MQARERLSLNTCAILESVMQIKRFTVVSNGNWPEIYVELAPHEKLLIFLVLRLICEIIGRAFKTHLANETWSESRDDERLDEVFFFMSKQKNNELEAICQHVKGLDGDKAWRKVCLIVFVSLRAIYKSDDDDGMKR